MSKAIPLTVYKKKLIAKFPNVILVTYGGRAVRPSDFYCKTHDCSYTRSVSNSLNHTIKSCCPIHSTELRHTKHGNRNKNINLVTLKQKFKKVGLKLISYEGGKLNSNTLLLLRCEVCKKTTSTTWSTHRARHYCGNCQGRISSKCFKRIGFKSIPEREMYEELISIYGESDILTESDIQPIHYVFDKKVRKYTPDFYIKSLMTYIEIKSTYTLGMAYERNIKKYKTLAGAGFTTLFVIATPKYYAVLPNNWIKYKFETVKNRAIKGCYEFF